MRQLTTLFAAVPAGWLVSRSQQLNGMAAPLCTYGIGALRATSFTRYCHTLIADRILALAVAPIGDVRATCPDARPNCEISQFRDYRLSR